MEEEKTQSLKKSYLEAALTPVTTPNTSPYNSPSNLYVIKNQPKLGIIETRLKWYTLSNLTNKSTLLINTNVYNYETCNVCKKGLIEDECNSYYTVYVKRYIDNYDNYRIKIFNDKETCDALIYCYQCMKNKNEIFLNETKNSKPMSSLILS